LFLRSFVQLEEGQRNNMIRSNVLAIDRLVYPSYDLQSSNQSIVEFAHEYGGIKSLIKFILYRDNKAKNEVQNLLINILKTMSSPTIPEEHIL
jgi:hypothetical protein